MSSKAMCYSEPWLQQYHYDLCLHADDCPYLFFARHSNDAITQANHKLQQVLRFFKNIKSSLNITKSTAMVFSKAHTEISRPPQVLINSTSIEFISNFKLLGVTFHKKESMS